MGTLEREALLQFLIEAVALAAPGGIVGMVVAMDVCIGFALAGGVPCLLDPTIHLWTSVLSAGIGMLLGCFPARRAAPMNPIEALLHE